MSITLILGIVLGLVVLVGVLVGLPLLDRGCAALAERKAGELLAVPFGRAGTVRVLDRPFLTQAVRGCYRDVQVSGGGLRIGEMTGATLDAQLRNVRLPLRDLLGRRVAELPCDRVEGRVELPYGELARAAKIQGLELRPSRGKVIATAVLPVPGIGQLARVTGRAVLSLGEGSSVWLRVRGVSVAGISLPAIVLNQLLPSLDVPIALPALPFGLRIDELVPAEDGLLVLGSADAVVFRQLAAGRDPDGDAPDAGSARHPHPAPARRPRPTIRDERPDL